MKKLFKMINFCMVAAIALACVPMHAMDFDLDSESECIDPVDDTVITLDQLIKKHIQSRIWDNYDMQQSIPDFHEGAYESNDARIPEKFLKDIIYAPRIVEIPQEEYDYINENGYHVPSKVAPFDLDVADYLMDTKYISKKEIFLAEIKNKVAIKKSKNSKERGIFLPGRTYKIAANLWIKSVKTKTINDRINLVMNYLFAPTTSLHQKNLIKTIFMTYDSEDEVHKLDNNQQAIYNTIDNQVRTQVLDYFVVSENPFPVGPVPVGPMRGVYIEKYIAPCVALFAVFGLWKAIGAVTAGVGQLAQMYSANDTMSSIYQ